MFHPFHKKGQSTNQEIPVTGRVGSILAKTIRMIQTRFAMTLQEKERKLTIRQKKWALLIFCIGMTGLSGYWIFKGVFSVIPDKPDFLKTQAITSPQKTVLPDSLDLQLLKRFQQRRATTDKPSDSVNR